LNFGLKNLGWGCSPIYCCIEVFPGKFGCQLVINRFQEVIRGLLSLMTHPLAQHVLDALTASLSLVVLVEALSL